MYGLGYLSLLFIPQHAPPHSPCSSHIGSSSSQVCYDFSHPRAFAHARASVLNAFSPPVPLPGKSLSISSQLNHLFFREDFPDLPYVSPFSHYMPSQVRYLFLIALIIILPLYFVQDSLVNVCLFHYMINSMRTEICNFWLTIVALMPSTVSGPYLTLSKHFVNEQVRGKWESDHVEMDMSEKELKISFSRIQSMAIKDLGWQNEIRYVFENKGYMLKNIFCLHCVSCIMCQNQC